MVHRAFRTELHRLPELTGRVRGGDRARRGRQRASAAVAATATATGSVWANRRGSRGRSTPTALG